MFWFAITTSLIPFPDARQHPSQTVFLMLLECRRLSVTATLTYKAEHHVFSFPSDHLLSTISLTHSSSPRSYREMEQIQRQARVLPSARVPSMTLPSPLNQTHYLAVPFPSAARLKKQMNPHPRESKTWAGSIMFTPCPGQMNHCTELEKRALLRTNYHQS